MVIIQLTLVHVRQETRTTISNDWAQCPPTLRIHALRATATTSEPHGRQAGVSTAGPLETSDATIHPMIIHLELTTHFIRQMSIVSR